MPIEIEEYSQDKLKGLSVTCIVPCQSTSKHQYKIVKAH